MHRSWEIPEVVELICAQIGVEDERRTLTKDATRDLAVVARSSKVFLNPALDVLWKHQATLANLIRCMPSDLWDIRPIADIRLRRPILPTDWERPLFYMDRVRSFATGFLESTDFFNTLGLCLPGDWIFPNLELLNWQPWPPRAFHHARLFLTPRIRVLELGSIENISHLSILSNLAVKCPLLTTVFIRLRLRTVDGNLAVPILSNFLGGLSRVESLELEVPQLDQTALAHLAQLPRLWSLVLRPYRQTYEPTARSSIGFSNITCLTVPNVECATALIILAFNAPLDSLTITETARTNKLTKSTAREFYSVLEGHCSHDALMEIKIAQNFSAVPPQANQIEASAVDVDILRPLFSFGNLIIVTLAHPVGFDLDDTAILEMACAWPRAKQTVLTSSRTCHMRSRVTLASLGAFARHCPSLEVLGLMFNATHPPVPVTGVAQQTLELLEVAHSPISEPSRVSAFLRSLFPQLHIISTLYEDVVGKSRNISPELQNSHSGWSDVQVSLLRYRC
ncbi:hypothetical protein B0H11DRAFT_1932581 [Mycena galericulata]|nr:hypothetical protein B0H11DRAFT_1932581 [Mycena galericulata]